MNDGKQMFDTVIIGSGPSFAIKLRMGKPALLFCIRL